MNWLLRKLHAPSGYMREEEGALGGSSSESRGDRRSADGDRRHDRGGNHGGGDSRPAPTPSTPTPSTPSEPSGGNSTQQSSATQGAADAISAARRSFGRFSTDQSASQAGQEAQEQGGLTSSVGDQGPQYGRYSTPGPIGGASSYGVSESTAEAMGAPHQATSPERQENYARDVIGRGGPQTESEAQRLESLASGRSTRQAVDIGTGVLGLGNPAVGAGVNLAADAATSLASPEFQAGYSSVDEGTTGKIASGLNVVGQVAGSPTIGRLAQAASSISPFADAAENQLSDRQGLYDQIGQYSEGSQVQSPGSTGSDRYQTPTTPTAQATAQPSMANQFVERSTIELGPSNYTSYLDNYLSKYLK